jgi:hypothetical protein
MEEVGPPGGPFPGWKARAINPPAPKNAWVITSKRKNRSANIVFDFKKGRKIPLGRKRATKQRKKTGRISELPSFSFFREKMRIRASRAMHQGKKKGSLKMGRITKGPVKNPRLIWEPV